MADSLSEADVGGWMNRRKLWNGFMKVIQLTAILALVCVIIWTVYRYIQYGEGRAEQTSERLLKGEDGWPDEQKTDRKTESETGQEEQEREETAQDERQNDGTKELIINSQNTDETSGDRKIRVRILSQDYAADTHEALSFTSDGAFEITECSADALDSRGAGMKSEYSGGECFEIAAADMQDQEQICIQAKEEETPVRVTSFRRADGEPEYYGKLYLYLEDGGIVLVNELPLEQYLYSVVSSEIPSYYPMEAQKAQAVCARTYAVTCIERWENSGSVAALDDSVSYQVYNNYRSSGISRQAVDETRGEILAIDEVLYFSTSCLSEHREDLDSDTAFAAFLEEQPDLTAEYGSPWIRWEVSIEQKVILEELAREYNFTADHIDCIEVTKRAGNGQVQRLKVSCGKESLEIEGEYMIRCVLSPEKSGILLADGSKAESMKMLPSAFFVLDGEKTGRYNEEESSEATADQTGQPDIVLWGGGYGHGIGMSQCGAAAMADEGADYREILSYYYDSNVPETEKKHE